MVISRAQMGSQLKGNKMKKPVKRKAGGGIVDVVPRTMRAMEGRDKREGDKDGPSGPSTISGPRGMKRGGKVTRGDGMCRRGKTKGAKR